MAWRNKYGGTWEESMNRKRKRGKGLNDDWDDEEKKRGAADFDETRADIVRLQQDVFDYEDELKAINMEIDTYTRQILLSKDLKPGQLVSSMGPVQPLLSAQRRRDILLGRLKKATEELYMCMGLIIDLT